MTAADVVWLATFAGLCGSVAGWVLLRGLVALIALPGNRQARHDLVAAARARARIRHVNRLHV